MENEHMIFDDSYFMKDKHNDALTDNDKQRIEQEIDGIYKNNKDQYTVRKMMHQIAEYATIYERKEQAELRDKVEKLEGLLNEVLNDVQYADHKIDKDLRKEIKETLHGK